jgi:hypothetical protein
MIQLAVDGDNEKGTMLQVLKHEIFEQKIKAKP